MNHPNARTRPARAAQARRGTRSSLADAVVPLVFGCALLGAAGAAKAQSIVVRSTGPSAPSHPRGQRLPHGAVITLRAGDIVTVLDKVGTRVLRGPGTFTLDAAVVRDNGVAARLSRSLGDPASLRSTLRAGAVRGPGSAKAPAVPVADTSLPETIWLADVDAGGTVCVPQGSRAYLWRRTTATGRAGTLGTTDDRVRINVQWPAQAAGAPWPVGALPLGDGATYRFTDDAAESVRVEFRIVSLDPATLPRDAAGLGALLLDKGCTAQFDRLTDRLEGNAAKPGG